MTQFTYNTDPSATDLILKFSTVIFELQKIDKKPEENNEIIAVQNENSQQSKPAYSLKTIALKMLALKVAAFLNWDLGK